MSEDARIAQSVRAHGWHSLAVEGTENTPPLLYTIGLGHTFGQPEIMVFGWEGRFAYSIVNEMVLEMKKGHSYSAGQTYPGLLEGYDVAVRPVHPTQHLLHLNHRS